MQIEGLITIVNCSDGTTKTTDHLRTVSSLPCLFKTERFLMHEGQVIISLTMSRVDAVIFIEEQCYSGLQLVKHTLSMVNIVDYLNALKEVSNAEETKTKSTN